MIRVSTIVDTTCPWVSKVGIRSKNIRKKTILRLFHGKYNHEETIATSSFANKYLVVLNLKEAEYVCDYISTVGIDRNSWLNLPMLVRRIRS